jgi:hypothetical protein
MASKVYDMMLDIVMKVRTQSGLEAEPPGPCEEQKLTSESTRKSSRERGVDCTCVDFYGECPKPGVRMYNGSLSHPTHY